MSAAAMPHPVKVSTSDRVRRVWDRQRADVTRTDYATVDEVVTASRSQVVLKMVR